MLVKPAPSLTVGSMVVFVPSAITIRRGEEAVLVRVVNATWSSLVLELLLSSGVGVGGPSQGSAGHVGGQAGRVIVEVQPVVRGAGAGEAGEGSLVALIQERIAQEGVIIVGVVDERSGAVTAEPQTGTNSK